MQIITPPKKSITKISIGSMQMRFTELEEMAITTDPLSNIIRSRLFNREYADLKFYPLVEGVTYIVNMLLTAPHPFINGQMLVTDANARIDKLLEDGTEDERP